MVYDSIKYLHTHTTICGFLGQVKPVCGPLVEFRIPNLPKDIAQKLLALDICLFHAIGSHVCTQTSIQVSNSVHSDYKHVN